MLRDIHNVNQMLAEFLPVPQDLEAKPERPKSNLPEEKKRYDEDLARYAKEKEQYDRELAGVTKEMRDLYKPQQGEVPRRFLLGLLAIIGGAEQKCVI